ncbi:MAG: GNAT family N-acetyltransferase [Syntrophaceae bacterium]|nr:GNAT family N-acetyltransferase [Syntrophaceae bacterium]
MRDFTIGGYIPGTIGRVVELHAQYYSTAWDFGLYFETKLAMEMSEFVQRFDPERDGIWTISRKGYVGGAIVIDGLDVASEAAHLRWFIVSEKLRGLGFGNRLMTEAVQFCRRHGFRQVYLCTFKGLHTARHLYEKFGFRLMQEMPGKQWGTEVLEQKYVLVLH